MENWQKVKELVNEVLNLDASERENFLNNTEIDEEIREEVRSLIAFEEDSENLINLSAVEFSKGFFDDDEDNVSALLGQTIGAYKIISELGYGGMGAVYLAERADGNFSQRVALKLLKREMNTSALRRRFQNERQILESLEHPNIARLLNAGTTDDNIPYIAMEYVEGIQIDDYCNRKNLELNERLDLFREVCEAVDFAHRNLIVHRDLKPSNILVNENGKVKLLDFGISKIVSDDFKQTDSATITKLGVMTPSYASPEQIQGKSVTTATDIYSLGVILYEILSGHRPFETKEDDLKDIYQAILEIDPPLPSSMVETSSRKLKNTTESSIKIQSQKVSKSFLEENTESQTETNNVKTQVNKTSQTNAYSVNLSSSSIRGDLDNIVLKALRKEPERRYSSVDNFSEDIHRYLRGLPVTARPNTFSYRTSKFIKRNRFAFGAAVLIIITLIGGIFATLWQARQARAEAAKAEKINEFLQNILNFSNPHWLSSKPERNREAKISDALDEALKNLDRDLADEPEVRSEILFTIGKTYLGQGQYDKTEEILKQVVKQFDQIYGEESSKAMQARVLLAETHYAIPKRDEAEINFNKAINYFRSMSNLNEDERKFLAIALTDLGHIISAKGKFDEAEKLNKESLELAKTLTGKNRYVLPVVNLNLGYQKFGRGNFEEALKYYRESEVEIRSQGNSDTIEMGQLNRYMGEAYRGLKDYEKAKEHFKLSYEIQKNSIGENDLNTQAARIGIAQVFYLQEKYKESEELIKEIIPIHQKIFPNGHPNNALVISMLGKAYTKQGKLEEGEKEFRRSLNEYYKLFKEPNPSIALAKAHLANNLVDQKRYDEAKELFTSAIDNFEKTNGNDHPYTIQAKKDLQAVP